MLKKIITYQRVLLNSMPPIGVNSPNIFIRLFYIFTIFITIFINMFIFSGNTTSTVTIFPIALAMVSIWMINRILYDGHRLFETVPVSRKYIVLNVFLLSIVIVLMGYIAMWIFGAVSIGIIFGISYLVNPNGFNQSPKEAAVHQIINTTKGDLLMLLIRANNINHLNSILYNRVQQCRVIQLIFLH